ncbi:MAG: transcriptional regulator [Bacteroides sp.]|nr:transcriptional regulator [Bacteroides sp.]
MKLKTILYLLLFIVSLPVSAGWQRVVTNYSRHTYRAASQNWMTMQGGNGWMYFANNKGLLEFDGTNWETYPIHNAKMRAVKMGNDGCIYVGGLLQFGYFVPNELGKLDYVCLSDSIRNERVGNIWNVHVASDKVYYESDDAIYYLENDRLYREECRNITSSSLIDDCLYVSANGLYRMENNVFVKLPNTEDKVDNMTNRVVGIHMYEDKLLVVYDRQGIRLYKDGVWSDCDSKFQEQLKDKQLFCSAMNNHLLAIGTVQNGVYLLNLQENTVEHISVHNGLQNKTVLSLCFDKNTNLWLGLDNGIDCIHLHSPILQNNVVIGSGYTSCVYQGKLYLGTNQGVFRTSSAVVPNRQEDMQPVAGISGQIYSLLEYNDELFCGGSGALWVLNGQGHYRILGIRGVWSISPLPGTDRLLAATYTGMSLLRKDGGQWLVDKPVTGFNFSAKTLCKEPLSNTFWMANKEGGLHRVTLNKEGDSVIHRKCYNNERLPRGNNVFVSVIDASIVVSSRQGLFYYNHQKDTLEHYERLEAMLDGCTSYTYVKQDSERNIWYVANGALKLLRYDALKNTYYRNKSEAYLKDCLIEDFESVHVLNKQEVLIGTEEGFSLLDMGHTLSGHAPLNLQIRHVYLRGLRDSLVYGCSFLPNDKELKIPYKHNSILIKYGTNNYDPSVSLLYSCRLEGPVADAWSQSGESTSKEYTMLPEGHYTFYVQTEVSQGETLEASFSFEVLPPWYRTWWSYLIYIGLLLSFVYGCYWRIKKGRKQLLMQKELELSRQKQIFQKESELKDLKIGTLKEEKLQAELHHKSEELVRTTLNIVRKNEMLQEIKKEVVGISHAVKEENLVSIRRKTLRLLGQIDTNIEHDDDLQAFQSTFDSVHHDFFRRLEKTYPELNNKDKLLCAYIKMNLLSKEIAPLMNISLRGVEIARYRLRKKLGLEEGANLNDFLQHFGRETE